MANYKINVENFPLKEVVFDALSTKENRIVSIDSVDLIQAGKIAVALKTYYVNCAERFALQDLREIGLHFSTREIIGKDGYFVTRFKEAVENCSTKVAEILANIAKFEESTNKMQDTLKMGKVVYIHPLFNHEVVEELTDETRVTLECEIKKNARIISDLRAELETL